MTTDPVVASDALDKQILAIPSDRVFLKRTIVVGFVILMVPVLTTLALVVGITADTNDAVKNQVNPLQSELATTQERNVELEGQVADLESVVTQQTDAILMLIRTLQQHGITPPEIVIQPPEDEPSG